MPLLYVAFLALLPLVLAGLLGLSYRRVQQSLPAWQARQAAPRLPSPAPKAALIVPLTGAAPGMRACLLSLLDQDYPNTEMLFATRDQQDPATRLLAELLHDRPNARHITAGQATACGQKNFNLLAGIAAASRDTEIFVFCDSNHCAAKDFLSHLIAPVARGETDLSTGFHRVYPEDTSTGTIGMLITVLAIHLIQHVWFMTQPWGGATAIRRRVFEDQGIARIWAENIVDDVSMAAHFLRLGVKAAPVPAAVLRTPVSGRSLGQWQEWLTRQLQYLKFCMPLTWVALILCALVLTGPVTLALATLPAYALGLATPFAAAASLCFLACFTGLGLVLRTLSPAPVSFWPWTRAFYSLCFMASWCYARTWCTNIMSWRGIAYRVGWGGKVREIIHKP